MASLGNVYPLSHLAGIGITVDRGLAQMTFGMPKLLVDSPAAEHSACITFRLAEGTARASRCNVSRCHWQADFPTLSEQQPAEFADFPRQRAAAMLRDIEKRFR